MISCFKQRDLSGIKQIRSTMPMQQMNEQLLIDGLRPFTFYTIAVRAVGMQMLVSPNSEEIRQRTNSTVPSVVVLSIDGSIPDATSDSITISLPPANFSTGPLQ